MRLQETGLHKHESGRVRHFYGVHDLLQPSTQQNVRFGWAHFRTAHHTGEGYGDRRQSRTVDDFPQLQKLTSYRVPRRLHEGSPYQHLEQTTKKPPHLQNG